MVTAFCVLRIFTYSQVEKIIFLLETFSVFILDLSISSSFLCMMWCTGQGSSSPPHWCPIVSPLLAEKTCTFLPPLSCPDWCLCYWFFNICCNLLGGYHIDGFEITVPQKGFIKYVSLLNTGFSIHELI